MDFHLSKNGLSFIKKWTFIYQKMDFHLSKNGLSFIKKMDFHLLKKWTFIG